MPTSTKSPRKVLQGPRPTPLKVRDESHKIKKQPGEPPQQAQQPKGPPRQPVIIYTVSPKIIHTDPNEFMTLVQRLTGPQSTSSPSSIPSSSALQDCFPGAISPAGRPASIEKTRSLDGKKVPKGGENDVVGSEMERTRGVSPGILSPNPASLPQVPSNFFTQPSDHANQLGYFNDLSPVLHRNKNYLETSFAMHSPSTFASPHSQSLDLFNNLFDLSPGIQWQENMRGTKIRPPKAYLRRKTKYYTKECQERQRKIRNAPLGMTPCQKKHLGTAGGEGHVTIVKIDEKEQEFGLERLAKEYGRNFSFP